jgi:hypothetical protein
VAATLAVALVAFAMKNPDGQRLIDEPVLNTTIVLVIITSALGLVLADRVGKHRRERGHEALWETGLSRLKKLSVLLPPPTCRVIAYEEARYFSLPQAGGGLGWGLFSPPHNESS